MKRKKLYEVRTAARHAAKAAYSLANLDTLLIAAAAGIGGPVGENDYQHSNANYK